MKQSSRSSRRRVAAAALLGGVLFAVPGGYVLASHQFSDVPTSSIYHNDIDALKDAGVTSGCGDGTTYCPSDFVTREQMAAFMNRLGALQAGKTPVVNADKLDGFSSGELSRVGFSKVDVLIDASAPATTGSLTAEIVVPARGYLIVSGNTTLYSPASYGNSTCELKLHNGPLPEGGVNLDSSYHQTSTGNPGVTSQCTSQSVIQVCSAATYMAEFYVAAGTGDTSAQSATLIVQYVPFNQGGAQPNCTSS